MRLIQGGLRLVAVAVACLWALDVVVHLDLVERLLGGASRAGGSAFLGILLVDAQVGAALAGVAWAGGLLLARLPRTREAPVESLALLGAGLCGTAVLVGSGVAWAAATAVALWLPLRWLAARGSADASLAGATARVLWPLLVVGFAERAWVGPGAEGGPGTEVLALCAAFALAGTLWVALGPRPRLVGVLPLLLAVGFALFESAGGAPIAEPARPSSASERPDIVLIVLDTLRADHLRSYGYARDTMPALERFAAGAAVASRAFSNAGWTSPAHASLLSGRNVSGHGVHYAYRPGAGERFWTRPVEGIAWLPQRLAREGYAAYAVSANELAIPDETEGFARVVAPRFVDWRRSVAGFFDGHLTWSAPWSERLRWRMPYVEGDRIVATVKRTVPDEAAPVFLFVNLMDAHSPYNPPGSALRALGIEGRHLFSRYMTPWELTQAWKGLPEGKHAYLVDLYDGGLRWLDRHLGELLAWIDARFGEDAVVIVTSDHGEMLGEEGRVGHDHGLSQSLLHVPLVIRSPGLPAGRIEEPVGLRALYDFVLRSAEGERPGARVLVDGGEVISERYPRELGGRPGRAWVSLVEGDVKAVGPSADGLEAVLLDAWGREVGRPGDDVARALGERIDRYWEEDRDRRGPEPEAERLSPAERDRLRALGYVD